jgi:CBS domain containing-hemolysin-like protein
VYTGLILAFALFLVCLNGFFVATEFAFVKIRKTRLDILAASGDKRAACALFGLTHLDAYLSICQLGITLASLGLGWLGEPAVAVLLHPLFSLLNITSPALTESLAVAVGFLFITFLHVVFGELTPKSVSIQKAEQTVLLAARPMRVFYVLCLPLLVVMNGISNRVLRCLGVNPASEAENPHSAEELRMLITNSSKVGQLDKEEGKMLDNIFSFYQKTARDIMAHRTDVVALRINDDRATALRTAVESGHTRFPVYENNRDDITGFVHIKDLLHYETLPDLRPILRSPVYAHETLKLDKLLKRMQSKCQQFCVVVDEYGAWQGILTMEDIVEAIVGDIQDEFDHEEPDFIYQTDGTCSISGDVSLDAVCKYLNLEHEVDETDKNKIIAAYFMEILERIPKPGDSIDIMGRRFTVTAMEKNRLRRILAHTSDADDGTPEADKAVRHA